MIIHRFNFRRGGFTLIETTIAFAISAVALVALLGLMATVLSTSGQTIDRFASARINQTIHQEFLMKDWEAIESHTAPNLRYFSEQGDAVSNDVFEAVYVARISISGAPDLPKLSIDAQERIQKSDRDGKTRARLLIEISNRVQAVDPFDNSAVVRRYSSLLVKLDK